MQAIYAAAQKLSLGGVVAHATEGVWGLAADPNNEAALLRILELKQRTADKGLLLLAADADEFAAALDLVASEVKRRG